ncbi:hypothetical protein FLACOL_00620 [Flavobacterium columnare]|uniref:Addiction module component n=2 Tax=Flavobacterium TaxID=237 RepID=A0ABW8PPF1_9FLAO|nr:hypothetical protein [Flavobacterium columnare]SPE76634.1 hypothetical protein FLACOL_00620 [Flavobacterium columnare]
MNTQQLQNDKLNIINWISQLQDYSVVEKIKTLMSTADTSTLTNEQKNAIDQALQSIETKGTIPHNTVMEETKKRFPHLYNR